MVVEEEGGERTSGGSFFASFVVPPPPPLSREHRRVWKGVGSGEARGGEGGRLGGFGGGGKWGVAICRPNRVVVFVFVAAGGAVSMIFSAPRSGRFLPESMPRIYRPFIVVSPLPAYTHVPIMAPPAPFRLASSRPRLTSRRSSFIARKNAPFPPPRRNEMQTHTREYT
jgi:hypothetical protein